MYKNYCHPYEGGAVIDWNHLGPNNEGEQLDIVQRETKMLQYIETVTTQPKLEQTLHLEYVLKKNANTEYLRKYGMNSATDVDTFRRCMPVADYEVFRNFIERIANGDKSPILSEDPMLEVLVSSGTTGGDPKIFPVNGQDLGFRGLVLSFRPPTLSQAMPSLAKGKVLDLMFRRAGSQTPCGLPAITVGTSVTYSVEFQQRTSHPIWNISSPKAAWETTDTNSAMYSHLLCALLQRHEIRRVLAGYATVVVKAMKAFEKWWADICEDIATGTLNEIVQDQNVRAAVLPVLLEKGAEWRGELAKSVRKECLTEEGLFKEDGIIPRLWPNCEVIDTGSTGMMKEYLPSLAKYSNNMRIICSQMYATSEGYFGVNPNPSRPPDETYYVLIPTVAYYEFIAISAPKPSSSSKVHSNGHQYEDEMTRDKDASTSSEGEVLDLVSLKVGQQYEILVTTISGYCRLRMGDILEVVGFYNNSPLFKFVRRKNVLLSVGSDKTDELELQAAVRKAVLIIEKELSGVRVEEYTSFTEFDPGHYVIVWELRSSSLSAPVDIPASLLDQCCAVLEASLNFVYRAERYESIIGPLELNLVLPGTFDLLYEYAVARGTSITQYKVPRGLGPKVGPLHEIVKGRVTHRHFSSTKPPFSFNLQNSVGLE